MRCLISPLTVLLLTLAQAGLAADPAPPMPPTPATEKTIEVIIYYQPKDSHWSDAQKEIDKVTAKFKTAHVTRVNTETSAGAKQLLDFIAKNNIRDRGDLMASVDGAWFVSKDDNRIVEHTLEYACTRAVAGKPPHKGKVVADVSAYAAEIYGKAAVVAPDEHNDGELDLEYFTVKDGGKLLGWVASAYYHIKCPVCTDTQFLAAVKSPQLLIVDLRPVRQLELRGTPLSTTNVNEFIGQFKNRTSKDSGKDVDEVSGATKTSKAYQNLVQELLNHLGQKQKKIDKDKEQEDAKAKDQEKDKQKNKDQEKDKQKNKN